MKSIFGVWILEWRVLMKITEITFIIRVQVGSGERHEEKNPSEKKDIIRESMEKMVL